MNNLLSTSSHLPLYTSHDVDLEEFVDIQRLCDDASTLLGESAQTHTSLNETTIPAGSGNVYSEQRGEAEIQHQEQGTQAKTYSERKGARSSAPAPEYSVICFPSNPTKPEGIKKKRRDFDERRRLEVAQVRRTGACFRYLHYIDYTARLLDQELIAGTTHLGPHRKVSLSMDYFDNPALEVEVQNYYGNKTPPWFCCWVVTSQAGGQIKSYRQESARYALPQLLPPSYLIDWVERIITHQETRCIGFQQAVDAFMLRYSKSSASLPMIRLGLILCVEEGGNMTPPSCALHTQFGQISKSASQPIEKEVLLELEKLVFGTSGIGPDNSIALWASLWCLILMYRKLVHTYMAFQEFPCHVPEDYSSFPECKLEVGTHFYHYLVSIYAALFRVTSPLYADFRVAATRKLLDDDESLIEAFMSLRTESFYFQRESMSMSASRDQLLRRMILDREAGLKPRQLAGA
ncbi:hypothetical protein F66182_10085 [Fusarium sp. NRRL 66182]|nr:hypothetical protein F66182_10085 [Fusarium sp. NRRL 66182]